MKFLSWLKSGLSGGWEAFGAAIIGLAMRLLDMWDAYQTDKDIDEAKKRHEEIDRDPLGYMDDERMLKPGQPTGFTKSGPDVPGNEADRATDSTK